MDPCTWCRQTGCALWIRLNCFGGVDSEPRPLPSTITNSESRPLPSTITEFRELNDHIYELYKAPGEPAMEILFFHGLQVGHSSNAYRSTWTCGDAAQQDLVWPATWLAEKFPEAHIFSISYDSSMKKTKEQGRSDIVNVAENLITCIGWEHIGQGSPCPVILVGHCFGGLVIKELCVQADNMHSRGPDSKRTQTIQRFLKNVGGVFFYGTPHRGIHLGDIAAHVLDGPLLNYVRTLSTFSARLEADFSSVCNKYNIMHIASVGELHATSLGPFHGLVVPEGSARYGHFHTVAGDHISICKPKSKTSDNFQHLTNFILGVAPKGEAKFGNIQFGIPKEAVGLANQVDNVQKLLLEHAGVGIVGMGGKGKTTLAKAVFNKLGPAFEYTCFVLEVKLIKGSMWDLERKVWKHLHRGEKHIGRKEAWFHELHGKRLLLVLDDVAQDRDVEFLSTIAERYELQMKFIVTSRDKELLERSNLQVHRMSFLSEIDARKLFVTYAFPNARMVPDFLEKYLDLAVKKCDGLPLTIEVLAKYLKLKENEVIWNQALEALDKADESFRNLDERLWAKLRVSYNALKEKEQQMFLDATTMFCGLKRRFGWTLREAKAGWRVTYGKEELLWQTLVDMSLVYNVKEDDRLEVHEQLQSLGRKIALESSKNGKCRAWDRANKMALTLLQSTTDHVGYNGQKIYSFQLRRDPKKWDYPKNLAGVVQFSRRSIQKLEKVQYLDLEVEKLIVDHGAKENEPLPLLRDLVLLRTPGSQFGQGFLFDPAFLPRLAVLKLSNGYDMKMLPSSFGKLVSLKILEIKYTELEILPDEFGHLSQLEHLTFESCWELLTLPETFGGLVNLKHLVFKNTSAMHSLPVSFGQLAALQRLQFHDCDDLDILPQSFGELSALEHLEIISCYSLHSLPDSFGQLAKLQVLQIKDCYKIKMLPDSIGHLAKLQVFEIVACPQIHLLPDLFGKLANLQVLKIWYCHGIKTLPYSFGQLAKLQVLEIVRCPKIEMLPFSAGQLMALRHLVIRFVGLTSIPEWTESISSLKILELGCLPFIHRCPQLVTSKKTFRVQGGRFVLQQLSSLDWNDHTFLRDWLHETALSRVSALDYQGAAAVLNLGLESLDINHGQWGFMFQERGIIKRMMGDLDGALDDLTYASKFKSRQHYWPISIGGCLRHMGFVRFLTGDVEGALEDAKMALKAQPWSSVPGNEGLAEESVSYLNFKFVGITESEEHEKLLHTTHSQAMEKVRVSDFQGALRNIEVIDARVLVPERRAFFLQERGILKRLLKDLEGALADLTDALEIHFRHDRDNYQCRKHRGLVKYLLGDLDGAQMDAERALWIMNLYEKGCLNLSKSGDSHNSEDASGDFHYSEVASDDEAVYSRSESKAELGNLYEKERLSESGNSHNFEVASEDVDESDKLSDSESVPETAYWNSRRRESKPKLGDIYGREPLSESGDSHNSEVASEDVDESDKSSDSEAALEDVNEFEEHKPGHWSSLGENAVMFLNFKLKQGSWKARMPVSPSRLAFGYQ